MSSERQNYRKKVFEATFDWLKESLPKPADPSWRVLDIGSGRHGWATLYRAHFSDVRALDLSDFSEWNPGVSQIVADVTKKIPLPDKSIHLVVSHSALEHVHDVGAALQNIDRVLKVTGYVFITVAPLYFSAEGSHIRHPERLARWEHLRSESPWYLIDDPIPDDPNRGGHLNKMTLSDVLREVGRLPWSITRTKTMIDSQPIPPGLREAGVSEMDLRCRGFFLLAQKVWHCCSA